MPGCRLLVRSELAEIEYAYFGFDFGFDFEIDSEFGWGYGYGSDLYFAGHTRTSWVLDAVDAAYRG
jgi:hypothetical protein